MAPPSPVSVMSELSEAWQRFSRDRRWRLIGGQQEIYYRLLTFQSRNLHLWTCGLRTTWSFLRLLIFGTCGPKHFLCHPFLTKLSVISPLCQLEDWHRRSGDWWHQTMPISVISEILTQLHNVPAAASTLLFTGTDADQWSVTMLWLVQGIIGHNILIGFRTLYEIISSIFIRTKTLYSSRCILIWLDGCVSDWHYKLKQKIENKEWKGIPRMITVLRNCINRFSHDFTTLWRYLGKH